MSRDIKFRSWNKNSKDMAYNIVLGGDTTTEQDDEVLMQYTGLKDKNGKEIYEGDIVEWSTDNVGGKDHMAVTIEPENGIVRTYPYINDTTEIVGNVHENPELLEGKA